MGLLPARVGCKRERECQPSPMPTLFSRGNAGRTSGACALAQEQILLSIKYLLSNGTAFSVHCVLILGWSDLAEYQISIKKWANVRRSSCVVGPIKSRGTIAVAVAIAANQLYFVRSQYADGVVPNQDLRIGPERHARFHCSNTVAIATDACLCWMVLVCPAECSLRNER